MSLACLLSHANQGNDLLPSVRTSPFAGFSRVAATAGTQSNTKDLSAHEWHLMNSKMPFNPR